MVAQVVRGGVALLERCVGSDLYQMSIVLVLGKKVVNACLVAA